MSPHYVFDNFVVGPSNRLSFAAAVAVAESPGTAYNPLFLHGAVGLGKTHLLQAICHAILRRAGAFRVQYLSCEQFVNQFISCIREGNLEKFRDKYRSADMLIIDDIQFLSEKERCQEEFFHTFNTLHIAQKQIVLASDCPPQELRAIEARLVSRFRSGLVAHLEPPDYETRSAIVIGKTQLRGMSFPSDVVDYISSHIRSNVRELEGAVMKLISYSHLMNRQIDLALATEALADMIHVPRKILNCADVQNVVTNFFQLKPGDLTSPRRTKSLAFPRQISMFLIRELTELSLEEIGDAFGGRDHTTVLYAIEKIRVESERDPELSAKIQALRQLVLKK